MIENKKVFILGMARSGYEVAKLLSKYNNDILITDMKEQDSDHVKELEELGVKFVISEQPEYMLDASYDYVIKNPGISAFFMVQLSNPHTISGKTIALTIQTFAGKVMSLLFSMLLGFS